jgi:NADH-quinone oxidoreductase subunit E
MDNNSGMVSCSLGCWLVAALGGVLAGVLLILLGGWMFIQAVFGGGVLFVVAGAVISWLICKPLPPLGTAGGAAPEAAAPTAAPAPRTNKPAAAPAKPASAPLLKPSAPLAGQAELDARKGAWTYQGDTTTPAKAPAAAPPAETGRPAALMAARSEGADNLKLIKGVGPKLEALLNRMGFYHFDQVANWTASEVAWVDENLEGFKGRVSRDAWVSQAKTLAAGGETEFSKRSKKS